MTVGGMSATADLAFLGLVFLALFGFSVQATRSVLAPAPLWNAAWCVSFATTAAFGGDFRYDTTALYVLAAVAACFNIGCVLNGQHKAPEPVERPEAPWIALRYLLVCLVVSAVGLVQLSRDLGTPLSSVDSLGTLKLLAQQNAVSLARGTIVLTLIPKVGFSVMGLGFALAGAAWRLRRTKALALVTLALVVVAFMWAAVTTQRSYFLVPVIWWVGGYVAATCWLGRRVIPPRALVRALLVLAGLVFFVVWLRGVRTGGEVGASSSLPWLAGYLPAFSAWYAGGMVIDGQVPGFLGGITGLIGTKSIEQSGGDEYIGAGAYSNAPTMMRDVFAINGAFVGALLVVVLGIVAHAAYRRALAGRPGGAAAYAGVVAAILWATNAWFYAYGGRVLTLLALLFLAWWTARRRRRGRRDTVLVPSTTGQWFSSSPPSAQSTGPRDSSASRSTGAPSEPSRRS